MESKQGMPLDNPVYAPEMGQGGMNMSQPPQYRQQQYAPSPGVVTTTVITSQPAASVLMTGNVQGHREWTTGVCGCTEDVGDCVYTYFCWCCVVCDVSKRLGDCPCMPFCVPGAEINMRTRVRTLGGIKGSVCMDCLVVSFCFTGMCALCQMNREMKAMGI